MSRCRRDVGMVRLSQGGGVVLKSSIQDQIKVESYLYRPFGPTRHKSDFMYRQYMDRISDVT